jgi:rRNA maturation protein Nop10
LIGGVGSSPHPALAWLRETPCASASAPPRRAIEEAVDRMREERFNHQNDVTVAYKAFYNRLARPDFAKFMHQMFDRLLERLCIQTLAPEGKAAVSRFEDIVIQDGSSFALKNSCATCSRDGSRRSSLQPSRFTPRDRDRAACMRQHRRCVPRWDRVLAGQRKTL